MNNVFLSFCTPPSYCLIKILGYANEWIHFWLTIWSRKPCVLCGYYLNIMIQQRPLFISIKDGVRISSVGSEWWHGSRTPSAHPAVILYTTYMWTDWSPIWSRKLCVLCGCQSRMVSRYLVQADSIHMLCVCVFQWAAACPTIMCTKDGVTGWFIHMLCVAPWGTHTHTHTHTLSICKPKYNLKK